jgi:hypothetical protein
MQQRRALADDAVSARHAEARDKPPPDQRWHPEIGFRRYDGLFGSVPTSRHDKALGREMVLRVITHNLTLLVTAA